jgi:hypothetical protein
MTPPLAAPPESTATPHDAGTRSFHAHHRPGFSSRGFNKGPGVVTNPLAASPQDNVTTALSLLAVMPSSTRQAGLDPLEQPTSGSQWFLSVASPLSPVVTGGASRGSHSPSVLRPSPADVGSPDYWSVLASGLNGGGGVRRTFNEDPVPNPVPGTAIDLEIYKPKVVDPSEGMIPDHEELTKGGQTFVNLDTDDKDGHLDDTDGYIPGGDDELVKIKLKIKPNTLAGGAVVLEATEGAGHVSVWKRNDVFTKNERYNLGTPLSVPNEFTVEGDWLVKVMWVNGSAPHTQQLGTKLKMTYDQAPGVSDEVALTVIGIESIEWQGRGNSRNDGSLLDADPNYPAGLVPGAVRVFPDARVVMGAVEPAPRDKVDVLVTLSVVEPIKLYFKSFDMDDPTSERAPVDAPLREGGFPADETLAEDNRGFVRHGDFNFLAGLLTGQDGSLILEKEFQNKTGTLEFQVTMQPGDNFRIAGYGDRDFVAGLLNHDNSLNNGATEAERNTNKQQIVFRFYFDDPSPGFGEVAILQPDRYASKTLTVWRFLHVERDSMGPPGPDELFGPDDVVSTNPASPDIALMQTNYRPAFIEVLDDLAALDTRDEIPFVHNLESAAAPTAALRDVPSLNRFWVVNLVGSYEGPAAADNDPNGESAVLGFTTPPGGSDGPAHIYYETIRDVRAYLAVLAAGDPTQPMPADEDTLVRRTVLHESGHRFNMVHSSPPDPVNNPGDQGPLRTLPNNVFGTDADNQFTPAQLNVIRLVDRPK